MSKKKGGEDKREDRGGVSRRRGGGGVWLGEVFQNSIKVPGVGTKWRRQKKSSREGFHESLERSLA